MRGAARTQEKTSSVCASTYLIPASAQSSPTLPALIAINVFMRQSEHPGYGPRFAPECGVNKPTMLYPSTSVLSNWVERDWQRSEGVQIQNLPPMQRIVLRTHKHAYEIFVRSGATGEVLVRGGQFFQEFTEARLTGSSLGGGFLKQYGIYVGLRVEFNINGEALVTSPVFSLSIESVDSRPTPTSV